MNFYVAKIEAVVRDIKTDLLISFKLVGNNKLDLLENGLKEDVKSYLESETKRLTNSDILDSLKCLEIRKVNFDEYIATPNQIISDSKYDIFSEKCNLVDIGLCS